MKKYLTSILLLVAVFSYSQENEIQEEQNSYYEVNLAYSRPTGEYKFWPIDENKGYALSGININLTAKNYLSSFWGFKYSANIIVNPVDKSFYYREANGVTSTLRIGTWKNLNFSLGPIFHTKNINNSTYFEISTQLGINSLNRPKVNYTEYENGQVHSANTIKNGFGIGFSIIPEVAFYTKLSSEKYLKVFFNYFLAPSYTEYKSQFLFYKEFENEMIPVYVVNSYEESIVISAFNLGVGISF